MDEQAEQQVEKPGSREFDLDNGDRVADFVTVPAGTYLCQIAEVRERETRAGDALWAMRLMVSEGEFVGRHAAWDNLVFSNRGLARVRRVLQALGLPSSGKVRISPRDLEGRQAFVEVRPSEYTHPSGEIVRRNEVPYDGYKSLEQAPVENQGKEEGEGEGENEIPF